MEKYKIINVPNNVYYIPNFISEFDENEIIEKVNGAPIPKWTQLSNRRLQNWGGVPHPKGMIAELIPQWLKKYMEKIQQLGIFDEKMLLNHVLVNEYTPGQGIMPHLDGPLFYPTVTTISCGSHTVLDLYKPCDFSSSSCQDDTKPLMPSEDINSKKKLLSLLVERRSLLILQDDMYNKYLHGISENTSDVIDDSIANLNSTGERFKCQQQIDRDTRISLTIRHVPKTTKLKLFF